MADDGQRSTECTRRRGCATPVPITAWPAEVVTGAESRSRACLCRGTRRAQRGASRLRAPQLTLPRPSLPPSPSPPPPLPLPPPPDRCHVYPAASWRPAAPARPRAWAAACGPRPREALAAAAKVAPRAGLRAKQRTEQVPARPSSAPPTRRASTSTPRNRRLHQHIRHQRSRRRRRSAQPAPVQPGTHAVIGRNS